MNILLLFLVILFFIFSPTLFINFLMFPSVWQKEWPFIFSLCGSLLSTGYCIFCIPFFQESGGNWFPIVTLLKKPGRYSYTTCTLEKCCRRRINTMLHNASLIPVLL